MDANRFDRVSRSLGSRRGILATALGGVLAGLRGEVDGKRKRKRRGNRNRKNCKRKAIKICTGNICGKRKNNCGKTFRCRCRHGQTCLPNGSCGLACPVECPQAPLACACPASGDQFCLRSEIACDLTPQPCSSIADCPSGKACAEMDCGPGGAAELRCVPLCHPSA